MSTYLPPQLRSVAQEYIDLYEAQQSVVNQYSAPILNGRRPEALQALKEFSFPKYGSEDWKHTNVEELYSTDYGIDLQQLQMRESSHHASAPLYSCDLSIDDLSIKSSVLNNDYRQTHFENAKRKLPQGAFVGSLIEFAEQSPTLAQQYYGRIAEVDTDGTIALNTLLTQDAFVLYISKGVHIEQPIQLVQLLRSSEPLLCCRRWLIILEAGASASLIVCDHTLDTSKFLINQVAEIFVGEGGRFELFDLEENSQYTQRTAAYFLHQAANSHATITSYTLNNGKSRNSYRTRFLGEHAEQTLAGMAVTNHAQVLDTFTRVEHLRPHCRSTQLFKNILDGESKGSFSGRIFVTQNAQKTEAYQSNHNMLLSSQARMYSKPQLEIYADDVQCSHGMATGEIDEQALFYMMQRGIPEQEARVMLSAAFLTEVVELMPIERIRERIVAMIRHRLQGDEYAHCSKCGKVIL